MGWVDPQAGRAHAVVDRVMGCLGGSADGANAVVDRIVVGWVRTRGERMQWWVGWWGGWVGPQAGRAHAMMGRMTRSVQTLLRLRKARA